MIGFDENARERLLIHGRRDELPDDEACGLPLGGERLVSEVAAQRPWMIASWTSNANLRGAVPLSPQSEYDGFHLACCERASAPKVDGARRQRHIAAGRCSPPK